MQPIVGHFDITVQQHDIAFRIVLHAPIGRRDKTQILGVFEQHDAVMLPCEITQQGGDFRVGRTVVHHHQPRPGRVRRRQRGFQATSCLFHTGIDRHHNINAAHAHSC